MRVLLDLYQGPGGGISGRVSIGVGRIGGDGHERSMRLDDVAPDAFVAGLKQLVAWAEPLVSAEERQWLEGYAGQMEEL